MNRRAFLALPAAGSLLGTRLARADRPSGTRRIGVFAANDSCEPLQKSAAPWFKELAKLGHVEGRNLELEWHCFQGDFARGARIASELARRKVDVLYTTGTPQTRLLQEATKTIPIVTLVSDPVAAGFTGSLARPDGNITGLAHRHPDTPAKQVELIRRVFPKLERLVIIGRASIAGDARQDVARQMLRPYETAARAAGLVPEVRIVELSGFDRVFGEMKGPGAKVAFIEFPHRDDEVSEAGKLALRHGVATIVYDRTLVEDGGLMSYTMHHDVPDRRLLGIFDKLLRGIRPGEIPWELPDRSHLVINLRTAKALGLTIPPDVLLRADRVFE
jgi:putative ABC transport system substrate-binding protein